MPDKVFKVVAARWNGKVIELVSSLMEIARDRMVVYKPGHEILPPKGSYLYAFTDLDRAVAHAKTGGAVLTKFATLQVFEAAAHIVGTTPLQTWGSMDRFWENNEHALEYPNGWVCQCHPTSVWCDSITLSHMVWGETPAKPMLPSKSLAKGN